VKSHCDNNDVGGDLCGRILQVACFDSSAISSSTGEPLIDKDPVRLLETVKCVGRVFEAVARSLPPPPPAMHEAAGAAAGGSSAAAPMQADADAVRFAYGPDTSWFKCPRPTCVRFSDGVPCAAARDKHESEHVRPYRCKAADCSSDVHGFGSKAALARHTAAYHTDDGDSLFPSAKRKPAVLSEAAKAGDVVALESMLANNDDVAIAYGDGQTALHIAAKAGRTEFAHLTPRSWRLRHKRP
jgi:hypothetical protein